MRNKLQVLLLFTLIIVFAGAAGSGMYFFGRVVPSQVEKLFGKPSETLDRVESFLLSARLYFNQDELLLPLTMHDRQEIFAVHPGDTGSRIAERLAEGGYIPNGQIFADYLLYRGIDRRLQSGVYLLPDAISPKQLADSLVDDNPEDVAFAFPPGWRVEEIAALLPSSGLDIEPEELILHVKSNHPDFPNSGKITSSEGFLLPGEYQILRHSSAEDLVEVLTAEFMSRLPKDYQAKVRDLGLSLHEAVILASMVEKETVLPDEAAKIAGVFLNRLAAGMPLQSDPTVQYAIGYDSANDTWWKNPLTSEDLKMDSLFNTYLYDGLFPGPICNPGLDSLKAVAEPQETDFLYFRAACDGSGRHVFSGTYEEHLQAACD